MGLTWMAAGARFLTRPEPPPSRPDMVARESGFERERCGGSRGGE